MNQRNYSKWCLPTGALMLVPAIAACFLLLRASSRAEVFNTWETPRKAVLKEFSNGDIRYKEFHPKRDPKYTNKIMNYILAIDENLKEDMIIIRTRTQPVRDYLFLKDKLYSVLELYGVVNKDRMDGIISQLTAAYGKPQLRHEKNLAIYTFSGSATKVFVHSSLLSQEYDCRIYYYSSNLFRKLIIE